MTNNMSIDIEKLTIAKAAKHLREKDFSATELAEAFVSEAKAKNPDINAYLEIFDDVEDQAKQAQVKIDGGTSDPLAGIPLVTKDNILIKDRVASAASKILENYQATYDSTVVGKLKESGVVFMGRANMDEFAMGTSTENSAFGPTKNPLDTTRVPGGSSGGVSAAVAMRGALGGLGTDTGGSVRQPAAFCGLVGLYPTYSTVSRYGIIAMASSLDQVAPMAHTTEDTEILWKALSVYDPSEATSVPEQVRLDNKKETSDKKVIGVPVDFVYAEGVDQDVQDNFKAALEKLESQGYSIKEITLPTVKHALSVYYILQPAEVSSNLARFDGIRFGDRKVGKDLLDTYGQSRGQGFGSEVRRRIMLGTYVLSSGYYDAYYGKAQVARNLITQEFIKAFEEVDFIATPTSPTGAFKLGEKTDPLSLYMADLFTVPANVAGTPAISIPFGKDKNDLPLGIQFYAPHFNEERLFTIGKDLEAGV